MNPIKRLAVGLAGALAVTLAVLSTAAAYTVLYENYPHSGLVKGNIEKWYVGDAFNDLASSARIGGVCTVLYSDAGWAGYQITFCPSDAFHELSAHSTGLPWPLSWNDRVSSFRPL